MSDPRIIPLGESAFIIRLSETLDRQINSRARLIADAVATANPAGLTDVVAANSSVGVYFDLPERAKEIEKALVAVLNGKAGAADFRKFAVHEIPVTYNGPDLAAVAKACQLTESEVIAIHSSAEYQVFAIGFAPGFAYMGELDPRIAVPRRAQPRPRVPAGSVAIANRQTAVYPFETPGGWNIIGATSAMPFDIDREPASLFCVGDRVRFTCK